MNGKRQGIGEHDYGNYTYFGEWLDDKRCGFGVLFIPKYQEICIGWWFEDHKEDFEIKYSANGSIHEGFYRDGKRISPDGDLWTSYRGQEQLWFFEDDILTRKEDKIPEIRRNAIK